MKRNELRPCIVTIPGETVVYRNKKEKKEGQIASDIKYNAVFHMWSEEKYVVGESFLVGGHAAGQESNTYAIVEKEDGTICRVSPEYIRFTDTAEEYQCKKREYNTITEIVDQLESCGYTCQGGRLEMNTAFLKLKWMAQMEKDGLVWSAGKKRE